LSAFRLGQLSRLSCSGGIPRSRGRWCWRAPTRGGPDPPEAVEQRLKQTIPDLDLPAEQVVAKYIPGLLTQAASPSVLNEVAAIMRDFHPAGMKTMVRSLAEANLRDVLPRIGIPTLLLYGDKDVRSPLNVAEDLHAAIAESRLVVIPEAGHLSNTEAAARFNAEIRDFLRSPEARRWRPPKRSTELAATRRAILRQSQHGPGGRGGTGSRIRGIRASRRCSDRCALARLLAALRVAFRRETPVSRPARLRRAC
jgi:hypothetical protein